MQFSRYLYCTNKVQSPRSPQCIGLWRDTFSREGNIHTNEYGEIERSGDKNLPKVMFS